MANAIRNEDGEKLVAWVQKQTGTLNIQHFETPLHPSLKDTTDLKFFRTTMDLAGKTFGGYGTDNDPELALVKSISECIERASAISCFGMRDSSGNACHFDVSLAKKAAVLELIERDAFFTHFLSNTPFSPLESVPEKVRHVTKPIQKSGAHIDFFNMQSANPDIQAILCRLRMKFQGEEKYLLSASASEDVSEACIKAVQEILSLTNNFLYSDKFTYSEEEIENLIRSEKFGPGDHAKLFFSPHHMKSFEQIYFQETDRPFPCVHTAPDIHVSEFTFTNTIFSGCGLSLAVAKSSHMQIAYWGYPKEEIVTFERLRQLNPKLEKTDVPWKRLHLMF